ncbi:hypothetical protein [Nesterenkonia flava]|uniref:THIF-type NAD/FAD binding fold domain-containing protein n=1 Tax=Nesterenkonia flava TaxID=469799 RepID=A0ABU1FR82_9MICC|nr:hypothetical protein [Nesterenkonia flava]MDR5710837.1 hypothetical protein [Nesterenkonia flava]
MNGAASTGSPGVPGMSAPQDATRFRRGLAALRIDGLGPVGLTVARLLLGLGPGTVVLCDDAPVGTGDLDWGYLRTQRGRERSAAAVALLSAPERQRDRPGRGRGLPGRQAAEPVLIEAPEGARTPGVDVRLVTPDAPWPESHELDDAGALLPLALHGPGLPEVLVIGPLLTRHPGPCADCLDLHGVPRPVLRSTLEMPPHLVHLVAAVTVHQVQVLLDGRYAAACEQFQVIVDLGTGAASTMPISSHPECACLTHLPAA